MIEISETEIKAMTKEQNYIRGYKDGKSDVIGKIRAEINSPNRGTCDYFIVDRIEDIIDKYTEKGEPK